MPGTRFGISDSPLELDARLVNIETELARRQLSNIQIGSLAAKKASVLNPLPQVIGLRSNNSMVGGIGVTWNAVENPDLDYYEIQISTNNQFTSDTTNRFKVTHGKTEHVFSDVNPTQSYFVRVRAVRNFEVGDWSGTLNTQSRLVSSNNTALGAMSNFVSDTVTFSDIEPISGMVGLQIVSTSTGTTIGEATITTTSGGIVIPMVKGRVTFATNDFLPTFGGDSGEIDLTVTLLRDGNPIVANPITIVFDTAGNITESTSAGAFLFDQPGAGVHTYQVNWLTGINPVLVSTPDRFAIQSQIIELVEYVR